MNRWTRLAAVAAAIAGLTAGPGCGMFDEFSDDGVESRSTHYPRNEGPPPPSPQRTAQGIPPAPAGPANGPGVFTDADKK